MTTILQCHDRFCPHCDQTVSSYATVQRPVGISLIFIVLTLGLGLIIVLLAMIFSGPTKRSAWRCCHCDGKTVLRRPTPIPASPKASTPRSGRIPPSPPPEEYYIHPSLLK